MSAEIEIRNGQASMMYARESVWHGLGTHVEKEVTAAAAIKLAGLDWTCEKRPIFLRGDNDVDGIPVIGTEIHGTVAVVRQDDSKVLGLVSPKYHIIQNHECFGFLDEIIGSGQAVFHTAGSLYGGRTIFCTVKLPNDSKIGDDLIHKYLLLTSSHDRKRALTVMWTPVRVVCANTLNVALGGKSGADSVVIRHTTNFKDKINQARDVLKLTANYYDVMEREFNTLIDHQFTRDQMTKLTKALVPSKDEEHLAGVTRKKREKLMELFEVGSGNEAVKGTKWAAFNAVTEFVDHNLNVRPQGGYSKKEAKMLSATFGGGARLKQKAFDLLTV